MHDIFRRTSYAVRVSFQDRVAPTLVFIYLAVVVFCFLLIPIFYINFMRVPFMGVFVEHSLMTSTVEPTGAGNWSLRDQLEDPNDYQLEAIDGEHIANYFQILSILSRYTPGVRIPVDIVDLDGDSTEFIVVLDRLPVPDQILYFLIPYLTGLIFLASGVYVYGVRWQESVGRTFALFTASGAIVIGGLFDLYTTNFLTILWIISLAIAGGALFDMALIMPETLRLVVKRPYVRAVPYIVATLLSLFALPTIYNYLNPSAYIIAWRLEILYLALAAVFFMATIGVRYFSVPSAVVREQIRLIFLGSLVAFSPITIWLIISTLYSSALIGPVFLLPLAVFPLVTGYTVIRYRLLSTDYLISRAMLYALLVGMTVIGYAILVSGLSQVFGGVFQPTNPILVAMVVIFFALVFNPARLYLQRLIDRAFFRGQVIYRERQEVFGQQLTQAMELQQIVDLLRTYISPVLMPVNLHVFVFDPLSGYYLATPVKDGRPTSDVRFPVNSALVRKLSGGRTALDLMDFDVLPTLLEAERARLSLLGSQIFVPMPGRQHLIGWLALGARRSGEPYNNRDMEYLEALSSQAALAVERAQVVADLERRVREMNVLTRVAQGVSFTISFDDILELIFAQTNQVLPTRDFRVTLNDQDVDALYHAFYLENDERLVEKENEYIPSGQGLEQEIITSQRSLVTDDYDRECRNRGLLPATRNIYAWMGVPLNAGAQTIGALSIGSRDPAVIYTSDQRDLLQAIADQASGAIVKARLLEESENRARQLATLNEIAVGLTSNLELKPLLQQILESATEMLSCDAGTLFLVDEETGELVFEVVLGPVASNLIGRRLPPGKGLVGEAVETGRPLIANDAKRRKQWFEQPDQQTGFDTQDMLVVPMRMHDQVIGVIEVINKTSGAPFTKADQDLLMAFTSQATIAIENARLYTMTDQALAARVEELSVMQRIDRELNASLEIDRAMRITLDWALRQSNAEAGFVGTVEADGVRVMISQGYSRELDDYQPVSGDNGHYTLLTVAGTGIDEIIHSGQPRCLIASEWKDEQKAFGILETSKMQIVIPIRRETITIGVLLLESSVSEQCSDELVNFLMRLADHAAIAISNSQLYEEVTEANLAKSRFVSFVAHELKNPMASIKGYTELVSGGVAGPVNEMQSSFLETVRSNVDRMNTIVSDLNDLTKIQVGNLRLEYHTIQIEEILEEVVRSLKRQIDDKDQQLVLELPQDMPAVWADPDRLAQILTNLVSNATKYTPQSGHVMIGAERMDENPDVPGAEFMHVWVKDTGIGINEEDQASVFQQYFRTEVAKEMATGTGLGLNITKSLVEMQGGRIWFESVVDEGTTFHITVPLAESG